MPLFSYLLEHTGTRTKSFTYVLSSIELKRQVLGSFLKTKN